MPAEADEARRKAGGERDSINSASRARGKKLCVNNYEIIKNDLFSRVELFSRVLRALAETYQTSREVKYLFAKRLSRLLARSWAVDSKASRTSLREEFRGAESFTATLEHTFFRQHTPRHADSFESRLLRNAFWLTRARDVFHSLLRVWLKKSIKIYRSEAARGRGTRAVDCLNVIPSSLLRLISADGIELSEALERKMWIESVRGLMILGASTEYFNIHRVTFN